MRCGVSAWPVRTLVTGFCVFLVMGVADSAYADKPLRGAAGVRQRMTELVPEVKVDEIKPTQIPGLYEVRVGPRIVYVTSDGRYMIQGSIVDLQTRRNLTEPRSDRAVALALEQIGEENMLVYGAPGLPYTVSVFTDIDSGSCRKLHAELAEFNRQGIRVRYLLFPRAGVSSSSYAKAVSVWCSAERKRVMDRAQKGESIQPQNCSNPISSHMLLGQMMGVANTPAVVLPDGELLPGYISPEKLRRYLEQKGIARRK